jgi:RNA polymerase sporulation-specific sigma factor
MDANQRIELNIKLVHSVCQKFTGEYEDLFQIGCIGLIKAAKTFKEEKGYAFSSYAIPIIRNEILMSLRKKRVVTISLDEPIREDGNGNIKRNRFSRNEA